ncbi:rod shape-determining protein MreD [Clostridium intestinale]|uniref:Rod shape-determining protein MreD n=1 Tax=Clostridium intestinale DSM 6191 TaxID=1121320 RepID=A0A1M5XHF5_9CLOT|nr:rod shape-determining protein MreD [Clostridium intestinale]SHH99251.1 rod shape-determining protein MreD [Clostridium intestinale DSM 6191]
MKRVVLFFIGIILVIIDNSILPLFSVGGSWGSLLFTFAICYSIITGPWEALWIGVYFGILQDIFFGTGFGVNCLLNMLICLGAAKVGETIFKNRKTVPVMIVLGATVVKYILTYVILYLLHVKIDVENIIVMTLMNTLFGFIFYKKIYKLTETRFMKIPWKFN